MTIETKVGLIGLGAMGRGVAANLAKKGFSVFGCDVREESRAALAKDDRFTTRPADLGAECGVVVSFVVNDAQTEAVLFGQDGLAATLREGSVFVACSTIPPAYAQALAPRLEAKGIAFVDAPVTGGAVGAAKGTLTVMASGRKAAFERARAVLEAFGARVHHLSEANGAGCQMKVINQLLCGVHLAAAAEALALAKAQGLPLGPTLEILASGAANSWMLGDRGPRMVKHDFDDVTSAVDIFVKDMSLVLDTTRASRFPAPLAHAAYMAFLATSSRGLGKVDDSAVITDYELRTAGEA
jgi:putative dehydrogenase